MQTQKQPIVAIKGLVKDFPGVRALSGVDLEVYPGEVHALIGENGAGKSTVIKILMGIYSKTAGEIYVEGELKEARSPVQAQSFGFGAVYQDVNLAQHLSVAENFFMGQLPKTKLGTVDFKKINRATQEILESIHVHVDPKAIIRTLSVAQQEMVAIGKTIFQKAKLVIFDEPTALLTNDETQQLFQMIKQLKNSGVGILYVSHRMEEIFSICDRASVLKDGALVGTVPIEQTTQDQLISMMVGRNVENMYQIQHQAPGETILKVDNISRGKAFSNISFEVKKGEIFGMFGLVGSGRTEIVRSIFGADVKDGGTVTLYGKQADYVKPTQGIKAGIALLPENRRAQGLALGLSVSDNINMVAQNKISRFGVVNNQESVKIAKSFCDKLRIKTPSVYQRVKNLSGGNQQKVVISKWLEQDSDLFIFDEPTVGVDVGAKLEIYKIFEALINEGKTIIMISSYLPEVMGLADRILIMYEGQQTGILSRDEFQEERILRLASGIKGKE
ncbi:sugar ABC transporter ATP-binding protein [Faecalispora jeddahensis]|uniref:sugar ABC transporter ATP-binding protein n=1 Tax=Faecalispora jeddahensis TaxID=1414721 RepID=UPI00145BD1D0|nr:sugar ABC transporter ATP-binding protein [Faecalispora jeddahensis]